MVKSLYGIITIFNFWTANVKKTNPGFGVYQKLSVLIIRE